MHLALTTSAEPKPARFEGRFPIPNMPPIGVMNVATLQVGYAKPGTFKEFQLTGPVIPPTELGKGSLADAVKGAQALLAKAPADGGYVLSNRNGVWDAQFTHVSPEVQGIFAAPIGDDMLSRRLFARPSAFGKAEVLVFKDQVVNFDYLEGR